MSVIDDLLRNPHLWRARERNGSTQTCGLPTGYTALDCSLPGGGWPQHGELWIRRGLVPKLVDSLTADHEDTMNGATGRFAVLTPREIEIARLIGQGASNKGIARQLSITERTVKAHLTMIFRKTGVEDRVKLALMVSRRH